MALKATICRADLKIADMDRNYYAGHALTVARHPSETDERMMVRLLAVALNAHEQLAFGRGLSDADEPDLWQKDLTGAIAHWIEVGQPEDKRLLRACRRAQLRAALGLTVRERLQALEGLCSVSINLAYRITLEFEIGPGEILLVNVGSHDEASR